MSAYKHKSWREKFDHPGKGLPKVVTGPPTWEKRFGGRRVLIATPRIVDQLIRKVKKGKLITIKQIRQKLAKNFKAESTCPLTTGIFIRIVSEVAEEDLRKGKKKVTPYWRVLKSHGSLNEKFPGGVRIQAKRLKEEGYIIESGKHPKVKDFEKYLMKV